MCSQLWVGSTAQLWVGSTAQLWVGSTATNKQTKTE